MADSPVIHSSDAYNPDQSDVKINKDVGGAELQIKRCRGRDSSDMTAATHAAWGLVHTNSQPMREEAGKITSEGRIGERAKSYEKAREKVKPQHHRGESKPGGEER